MSAPGAMDGVSEFSATGAPSSQGVGQTASPTPTSVSTTSGDSADPGQESSTNGGGKGRDKCSTVTMRGEAACNGGAVRPYGWFLNRIKKSVPGDIVKVRLKKQAGNFWIYNITVLNDSGRYVVVTLNATTGAILSKKVR